MNNAELYDTARRRIIELVANADGAAAVDACPGWTVKDLVGHLAAGLGDFTAQRFDGATTGEWGERHVRERRDRSLRESLDEWETNRRQADETLASPMGGVLVAEIVSHEHDIRAALDRPGARDDVSIHAALESPLSQFDKRVRDAAAPALLLEIDGNHRVIGDGEPAGSLRVSAFELLRAMGGRRSRAQIRALEWEGDADVWLDHMFLFGGDHEGIRE